jgi:hypothetical protein
MRFFLGKAFSEKQRKVKTSERRRKNERTHLNYSRAEKERTTKQTKETRWVFSNE